MIRNVQKLLRKKGNQTSPVQKEQPPSHLQERLATSLEENEQALRSIYADCSDVVFRDFTFFGHVSGMVIYIGGLTDLELLDGDILKSLLKKNSEKPKGSMISLIENTISSTKLEKIDQLSDCIKAISTGNVLLLVDGADKAFSLGLTKFQKRAIEEPDAEKVIRGPREGFIESLEVNTSLLRRIIKSPALKLKKIRIGRYTKTAIILAYIEGIAEPKLIEEMESRLHRIDIDGVLESEYIEEMIEDNPYSPFPQILSTERPDVVSAHLLEGRAAILTDGTPHALIAPVTFFSMLQAPDDYYERYIVGTLVRWMRYVLIIASLLLPSLYVAITTYHQEMIPDTLLLTIASARESVPYPALVEVILMEVMLEALREAGVRLPNQIGAAVSIVGALVIGQSAVQAGLVSAPMVIVVATTAIASFLVPRYVVGYAFRYLRFPFIFLAGTLGILGIMLGVLVMIIHLCSLRSFGEPYLQPLAPLKKRELKDVLWRSPFWMMEKRPQFNKNINVQRQTPNLQPGPYRPGETDS